MPTITERLLDANRSRETATLVLRSGRTITGRLQEVNLVDGVVVVDGWAIRVDEVAGARREEEEDEPVTR